jgi:hypothetical protein
MSLKQKKSAGELEELILEAVRQHQECNHIVGVAIIRPFQMASHHPNWDAAFTIACNEITPQVAFEIATKLKSKFDLA